MPPRDWLDSVYTKQTNQPFVGGGDEERTMNERIIAPHIHESTERERQAAEAAERKKETDRLADIEATKARNREQNARQWQRIKGLGGRKRAKELREKKD